jgi:hypothetical protein
VKWGQDYVDAYRSALGELTLDQLLNPFFMNNWANQDALDLSKTMLDPSVAYLYRGRLLTPANMGQVGPAYNLCDVLGPELATLYVMAGEAVNDLVNGPKYAVTKGVSLAPIHLLSDAYRSFSGNAFGIESWLEDNPQHTWHPPATMMPPDVSGYGVSSFYMYPAFRFGAIAP